MIKAMFWCGWSEAVVMIRNCLSHLLMAKLVQIFFGNPMMFLSRKIRLDATDTEVTVQGTNNLDEFLKRFNERNLHTGSEKCGGYLRSVLGKHDVGPGILQSMILQR